MDLESCTRWDDYAEARNLMLAATDNERAPWYIVRSDDKRKARLNCISHILHSLPFKAIKKPKVILPKRGKASKKDHDAFLKDRRFVVERY